MKKPYRQRRGKEQADNEKKQEKKNVIRSVNKSVPSEDAGWDEEAIEKGSNVWNRRKKKSHDETLKNSETDLWDDAEDPSVNSQVRKPFQNEMPRRETSEQGFTSYNPYWKNYEKSHRETENEWRNETDNRHTKEYRNAPERRTEARRATFGRRTDKSRYVSKRRLNHAENGAPEDNASEKKGAEGQKTVRFTKKKNVFGKAVDSRRNRVNVGSSGSAVKKVFRGATNTGKSVAGGIAGASYKAANVFNGDEDKNAKAVQMGRDEEMNRFIDTSIRVYGGAYRVARTGFDLTARAATSVTSIATGHPIFTASFGLIFLIFLCIAIILYYFIVILFAALTATMAEAIDSGVDYAWDTTVDAIKIANPVVGYALEYGPGVMEWLKEQYDYQVEIGAWGDFSDWVAENTIFGAFMDRSNMPEYMQAGIDEEYRKISEKIEAAQETGKPVYVYVSTNGAEAQLYTSSNFPDVFFDVVCYYLWDQADSMSSEDKEKLAGCTSTDEAFLLFAEYYSEDKYKAVMERTEHNKIVCRNAIATVISNYDIDLVDDAYKVVIELKTVDYLFMPKNTENEEVTDGL